ncbi:MAG: SH3 domain-containing protein [Treponema sp.]|nr:SH3 domain-containing protein [Treponema sp.]
MTEQERYFKRLNNQRPYETRLAEDVGAGIDHLAAKIGIPLAIIGVGLWVIKTYWMYIVSVAIAGICLFIIVKIARKVANPGLKILITGLVGIALIIIVLVVAPAPNKTQPVRSQTPSTQTTQVRYMLVNSDSLNVRSGPSSDHGVVGRLNKNTRVQIINSSGQWWKIKSGNIEGYVNSSYLIDEKPPSTPSTSSLPHSNLQTIETQLVQFIDPQTEPMHGEPRRLRNYAHYGWTGDHKFQDDYEKAVREYDRKRQALPPGLVLPGGKTVQETIDSDPVADK